MANIILYSEFEFKDALEKYQTHPEHEKVKQFVYRVVSKDELWIMKYNLIPAF